MHCARRRGLDEPTGGGVHRATPDLIGERGIGLGGCDTGVPGTGECARRGLSFCMGGSFQNEGMSSPSYLRA